MRQDALAGRATEIDYINGYILGKAKEFEIRCPCNDKIVDLVRSNTKLTDEDITSIFKVPST